MKIALVTNIVPPYRKPLFEEIGKHCDLTVICSAANEIDRDWQDWDEKATGVFKTITLKGFSFKAKHGFFYLQTGLFSVLRKVSPDVVINSSFSLNTFWGNLYAKMARKPSMIWSEATCFSERKQSVARRWFREMLVRLNDAYIPSGIEAKDFLLSLGAVEERCFTAVDAIEDIRKSSNYERIQDESERVRLEQSDLVLLFSGQLIERKGLDLLFAAYEKIHDLSGVALWIMGSGPLEKELKEDAMRKDLRNVKFLGFRNELEKWIYYLASDVFVLPTKEDVWGLVVNEAMLCRLPVICSKYAGCCKDLIEDEKTGFVIDPNDTESFAHVLRTVITNDGLRGAMSECAREKACEYSIKESTKGFLRAISFCQPTGRN
jgi:glycosyltransferase involved in cell wall biosynthesis